MDVLVRCGMRATLDGGEQVNIGSRFGSERADMGDEGMYLFDVACNMRVTSIGSG